MGAREYLEKYVRNAPGGAIAWERSIFSRSGQWGSSDLIDAAVDIAWDSFSGDRSLERPGLEIRRSGNFLVIGPLLVSDSELYRLAA